MINCISVPSGFWHFCDCWNEPKSSEFRNIWRSLEIFPKWPQIWAIISHAVNTSTAVSSLISQETSPWKSVQFQAIAISQIQVVFCNKSCIANFRAGRWEGGLGEDAAKSSIFGHNSHKKNWYGLVFVLKKNVKKEIGAPFHCHLQRCNANAWELMT